MGRLSETKVSKEAGRIKKEIQELKEEIKRIKEEIQELKKEFKTMKTDMDEFKKSNKKALDSMMAKLTQLVPST
ncbi:hypothetical protein LR48_Vigan03g135900 [Vigna angularis]|uniref:Uncharacterized protein n=1 Tax=Phaseolus angularis TaxID=3914 RepID=A0A0L9U5Q1_PHAAN|nr:hypothetical protein LR48_Vigan03g135900 [Vigna angularis]